MFQFFLTRSKYNLIDHALDTRNEELFHKLIAN
ncbi:MULTISPECIES: IDEAL domain-containing protein [Bacillus cereus group]